MQVRLPFESDAPVFTRHPRARRYLIRIADDGSILVTIPRGGSKREATAFVEREQTWIEKERRRVEQERQRADRNRAAPLRPEVVEALRERAKRELPERLLHLAARHGLQVTRVSVRNQQWRWGSCSKNGRICLNWRLVQMPDWVRDYVIVHELMHLKRMDHSQKFWALVARACPEYQDARKWLRSFTRLDGFARP
jgi:predicted metal-dependent hydrolase